MPLTLYTFVEPQLEMHSPPLRKVRLLHDVQVLPKVVQIRHPVMHGLHIDPARK